MKQVQKVMIGLFLALIFLALPGKEAAARSIIIPFANNQICPVDKTPIGRRKYNTAHRGRRYHFSSWQALKEFRNDPDRYIEEWKRIEERRR